MGFRVLAPNCLANIPNCVGKIQIALGIKSNKTERSSGSGGSERWFGEEINWDDWLIETIDRLRWLIDQDNWSIKTIDWSIVMIDRSRLLIGSVKMINWSRQLMDWDNSRDPLDLKGIFEKALPTDGRPMDKVGSRNPPDPKSTQSEFHPYGTCGIFDMLVDIWF